MGWITVRTGLYRLLPGLTSQPRVRVSETVARLQAGARLCDIGAGGRKITPETFTIDGFVTDTTNLVCDIHEIPLPDSSFDVIFCTGTLEHVRNPHKVMAEIHRLLSDGGLVHIEAPFLQGYHADPTDYWRWTLEGLRLFCTDAGFEEVEAGCHMGPTSTLNWIVNEYLVCLFSNGIVGNVAALCARVAGAPFLVLDRLLVKRSQSLRIASGIYFVGRKVQS
ncbi:MAG: class I SAM-dependent methyltransferase [Desulfuromonadales bacterium]|nr:MAG: class I SAM-dependent methyltransferase [Desulfuromonadales bacterium]